MGDACTDPAEATEIDEVPKRPLWTYGCNDLLGEEVVPREAKTFQPTGGFRADFAALCLQCGVVPHSGFSPPQGDPSDQAENPLLSLQSAALDKAALLVARWVLPATSGLQVLRLSGCCLDAEMLGLLKQGISGDCAVTTLHVDWNPLDVPVQDVPEMQRVAAEGSLQELDELERQRLQRQRERALVDFGSQLEVRFGSLAEGLQRLAETAEPEHPATATMMPLDQAAWAQACAGAVGLPTADGERMFQTLDSPPYGFGDGLIPMTRILADITALMEANAGQDEEKDPLALAFGGLVDASSTLEIVSFRCCKIGRVEAQAIGRGLASPAPHLRALNLWGNSVCDRGAEALSKGLELNFGLQYLGLGRNLVTHVGLQALCKVLGYGVVTDKAEADAIMKASKEKEKGKKPPSVKKDASGRDRYTPEAPATTCEEHKDDEGQTLWIRSLNTVLKTLVLEHNPISDAFAVVELQPLGCGGDLVLRGVPCCQEIKHLLELRDRVDEPKEDDGSEGDKGPAEGGPATEEEPPEAPEAETPRVPARPPAAVAAAVSGWRLILA